MWTETEKRPYPRYGRKTPVEREWRHKQRKPPPTNTRLKIEFSREVFAEWCDREKSMTPAFRRTFTRLERIIVFCKMINGWGRMKMCKRLGISDRQVKNCYKKLKGLGWQQKT